MENSTTRIIETDADIAEGIAALIKIEPRFRIAVGESSPIPLRRKPSGFAPLLQAIVGQQISVAAAAGIWKRVEAANATTPKTVLALSDDELRACGLSRPKVKYARAIAEACESRALCFDFCRDAPVEDAIKMMTAIKGVGTWTAEIDGRGVVAVAGGRSTHSLGLLPHIEGSRRHRIIGDTLSNQCETLAFCRRLAT